MQKKNCVHQLEMLTKAFMDEITSYLGFDLKYYRKIVREGR